MFADKNQLSVRGREPLTSGSVNVSRARFEFSEDWDGMKRTAVFKAGKTSRAVLLDRSGQCAVPWEVLKDPGSFLMAGVYGTRGGEVVLPTIWASLGMIQEGVPAGGEPSEPPTPDLLEQALAQKQDKIRGLPGQVVGFDEKGEAEPQDGITDHRALSNRDAAEQHPIESITGLKKVLDKTLTTENTLSVTEILKIMEA